jgi:hypothetical protein
MKTRFQLILLILSIFLILFGCNSAKEDEYYVNRTNGEKVHVVFVGSEKDMIARYGPSLKYQSSPEGTIFVMFEPAFNNEPAYNEARILIEKDFLKNYGFVKKSAA